MSGTIGVCTGIGLALLAAAAARGQARDLEPGDVAPAFSLPGSDGRTYTLADYKGKEVVVLAWFPKAFTGGCTAECKSLRESGDRLRGTGVAYFAASVDSPDTNRRFAESLELDYPILSDQGKDVARAYGVVAGDRTTASRWTFYIGKDGRILYIDKTVSPGTHGADMIDRLKALGVQTSK
jgi:thioredoxin-dependent peroxiredoxin